MGAYGLDSSADDKSAESKQVFDLSADSLSAKDDVIIATGNAFLLYNDIYMVAHKITYNKQSKIALLDGGAKIYKGSMLYVDVESIEVNMQDKSTLMTSVYLQSGSSMWIMANTSQGKDDIYTFKKAVVSGCDIEYPLWHINVSSGTYNAKKEYMSVWNPRFYIGAVPVFYLPYFIAPTGNKRKSGLLSPELSYSAKQGFMYMQPLFIAPYNRWDITLSPQVRTNRGYGGEVEFRIADNDNEVATLQGRFFENSSDYISVNNLKNKHIYGGGFRYKSNSIIFKNMRDTLYMDINYMNDLEYMRLKSLNASFNTRLYESRINYFLNTSNHYFGTYFKYYLDLSKPNNKETFQALPHLHYHYYTSSLFFKNLLYSFDFQSKNAMRYNGYGYIQNTASLPLGIAMPLFKDYISLGATLDFYGTSVSLNNYEGLVDSLNTTLKRDINYGVTSYNISLNSDIAKPYKSFFHSMHLEAIFSGALAKYTSDAIDDNRYEAYNTLANSLSSAALATYWNPSDIVDVVKNKHKVDVKFSQYFYGKSGKELFYLRMYQRIFLKDDFLTKQQVLRNELGFSPIDKLNLSASIFYAYDKRAISEAALNASFNKWGLDSSLTYYFKLDPTYLSSSLYSNQSKTGFARGSVGYDFGYFSLNANVGYDVGLGYLKDWYVTISKDIRCFGIGLKFAKDTRPVLTADNQITPFTNQYVKIEFRFVPLAKTGITYRFKEQ